VLGLSLEGDGWRFPRAETGAPVSVVNLGPAHVSGQKGEWVCCRREAGPSSRNRDLETTHLDT
jgi:hypothetical protein